MGLNTTHGCWNGPYKAYSKWLNAVATAAGYPLLKTDWKGHILVSPGLPDEVADGGHHLGDWDAPPEDILLVLLAHADNEGRIDPEHAGPLADRLEGLVPALEGLASTAPSADEANEDNATVPLTYDPIQAHIVEQWAESTRRFAAGLRKAADEGVPVEFR